MSESKGKRIKWADVLRAFALYSVILAHLGSFSQRISLFCFGYVMQLFFFVSGLFASSYRKLDFPALLKKLIVHLLVPHIILSAVNIAYAAFRRIPNWQNGIMQCVLAIRNKIMFPVLWYLPCLIVMTLVYWCLCRIIRNDMLRLVLCLAVSMAFRIFKEPSQWFWSSDSAMMFLFYYALGDILMPVLKKIPASDTPVWKKILAGLVALLCLFPVIKSYEIYNSETPVLFDRILSVRDVQIFTFVSSTAAILLFVALSYLTQNSEMLQTIGRRSMLLFAIQGPSVDLFNWLLWQIGVTWIPRFDWQVLFLGAARLIFSCFVFGGPVYWLLDKLGLKKNS